MKDVGMLTQDEPHPRNPTNNEEGNLRDGEILVNLNESVNGNTYESQQIVK